MKKAVVVGGGISGLATAWLLREKAREACIDLDVTVLEKERQAGGKIKSIRDDGFMCEWGPNGFLDSKPQTLDLCRQLGVDGRLLRSNDNARKRFIYSGGVLHRLPENGSSFLKSDLISWPGKLRLALEPTPFIASAPKGDESLAAFGRRRLGDEALRKLIAPMVSGIFAGDPETMSLQSCFPRIAELERDYGGLVRAMLKLAKKKKQEIAEGKAVASAAGPGGVLTSFRTGIQELTDIMAAALGDAVSTDETVERICAGKSVPYRVQSDRGEMDADLVILAAPAHATASMLSDLDTYMSHLLDDIPYSSMTVVCLGYEGQRIAHDLNGFGYLIPKEEKMNTLGTLWDSSIFEGRAPEGMVLLRSMLGGACFPQYIGLTDVEVRQRVMGDLKTIMGITAEPSFVRIFRHEKAIPQYIVGHGSRVTALEEKQKEHPGLFLTGNSYRGIGLNDCVAAANRTVEDAMAYLQGR